jgi:hypothetical protein
MLGRPGGAADNPNVAIAIVSRDNLQMSKGVVSALGRRRVLHA